MKHCADGQNANHASRMANVKVIPIWIRNQILLIWNLNGAEMIQYLQQIVIMIHYKWVTLAVYIVLCSSVELMIIIIVLAARHLINAGNVLHSHDSLNIPTKIHSYLFPISHFSFQNTVYKGFQLRDARFSSLSGL